MLSIATLLLSFFVSAPPPDAPVEWISPLTVDVGDILQGEDHTYTYYYINLTDAPLTVDNVRPSCGCTATDWLGTPVMPKDTGSISVTYDAMNVGYFRKNVKVFFRGYPGAHKLWLEGFVEA